MNRLICFFLGHWWSDWLVGLRRCWACGKVQTFDEWCKICEKKK